ncbi:asparagine synthase B [Paraphotobacterium marinum]|uniref:asparagine synthase (glutamine-hydrolyzing) n=1 Tax=Paraphotobacterium marinum TaxID=1755811 RepID=A0A220VDV4_9GAMM|nr:asparagine synthase B [Paraphotobacterium marinum]ASK78529.1 asparagine synthase B [Paraphotobacterium marinum]
MCGILGILGLKDDMEKMRKIALIQSKKLRHRGPDWSGIFASSSVILAHERLAIVGLNSGGQPLFNNDKSIVLAVNGEIYNHNELRSEVMDYKFQTDSDCEIIIALYEKYGIDFINKLNGIFSFILYDQNKDIYFIARDHIGIVPLYQGIDKIEQIYIASELKALEDVCSNVSEFPPGHYYSSQNKTYIRYYKPSWETSKVENLNFSTPKAIKHELESAVKRQLMCDVPYGVLLSGGLDSSIIASIAKKFSTKRIEDDSKSTAWWPSLHSFAIGLKNSPDLKAAQTVADYIGTIHHSFEYTIQEGLDSLEDIIYHLETYDITTIRASTPMFLMARKIKAMGIKMVLSGEGADEIFGGYLYFHKAPNHHEFHKETIRKVFALNKFDCNRANKSMAAWGIETRVPFLDKQFLDAAMNMDPKLKMVTKSKIEKQVLRDIFKENLPNEIINRQKEQFSDGVGYSWIDSLKEYSEQKISDEDMKNASYKFPFNTPKTKEGYLYRDIFEKLFKTKGSLELVPGGPTVACSTPEAINWDSSFKNSNDPSGRIISEIHTDGY